MTRNDKPTRPKRYYKRLERFPEGTDRLESEVRPPVDEEQIGRWCDELFLGGGMKAMVGYIILRYGAWEAAMNVGLGRSGNGGNGFGGFDDVGGSDGFGGFDDVGCSDGFGGLGSGGYALTGGKGGADARSQANLTGDAGIYSRAAGGWRNHLHTRGSKRGRCDYLHTVGGKRGRGGGVQNSFRAAWALEWAYEQSLPGDLPEWFFDRVADDFIASGNGSLLRIYAKILCDRMRFGGVVPNERQAEELAERCLELVHTPATKTAVRFWCLEILSELSPRVEWVARELEAAVLHISESPDCSPGMRVATREILRRAGRDRGPRP